MTSNRPTQPTSEPRIDETGVSATPIAQTRPEVVVAPSRPRRRRLYVDRAGLPIWHTGDRVRAERAKPAAGNWRRYAGRVGVVRGFDRASPDDDGYYSGRVYGVAVELDGDSGKRTWFLSSELVPE